jgi:hypothetical protein
MGLIADLAMPVQPIPSQQVILRAIVGLDHAMRAGQPGRHHIPYKKQPGQQKGSADME